MPWKQRRVHWPRVGLALRRRPRLWWAVTATASALVGLAVAGWVARAEAVRAEWGRVVPVVVAAAPIEGGDRLAGSTRVESWPAAVIPEGALVDVPAEARAAHGIGPGEVITRARVAGAELGPVAARLPSGERAVAIPVEAGVTPPLAVDDRVDVIVTVPTESPAAERPGFVLVRDATVVDVSDAAVTVAVSSEDAIRVAVALGAGAVVLALVGG